MVEKDQEGGCEWMNSRQAIKILKEEKSWESDDRKIEAFVLGIAALESVEALKNRFINGMNVHYEGDDAGDEIECPLCGYGVARNDDYNEMRTKHCPECGTKLIY